MFDAEWTLTESSKFICISLALLASFVCWVHLTSGVGGLKIWNDVSELSLLSSPFCFVISLKILESSLLNSFAVIVSGSLVLSIIIVEQNRFRALMSEFVFLTVLCAFCAEKSGYHLGYLSRSYSVFPPLELVHHHPSCFWKFLIQGWNRVSQKQPYILESYDEILKRFHPPRPS